MDAEVQVRVVKRVETRSGNTRWVLTDDADEVAWGTAVEAAPWLLGTAEPRQGIPPDERYEKLEPFKRRVAEDIREGDEPAGR